MNIIKPQPGFQERFLSNEADICIGGSGAGVGKSFALLLEGARNSPDPLFNGIIFRRTYPELKDGGLWDDSQTLYMSMGARPNESDLYWRFYDGGKLKFSHLQHEKSKFLHQGKQYAYIGFDELTHFTESQFFYLLSRNRSVSGIKPYVRATCNPDPHSWVRRFCSWWIGEDGYPIPERDGKLRYFIKDGDAFVWGNTKSEVVKQVPHLVKELRSKGIRIGNVIKSLSFVAGKITDNQILLEKNPEYLANLMSQPEDIKKQLLDGNWLISNDDTALYKFNRINDLLTNDYVRPGKERWLITDIALHGSDCFVMMAFYGNVLMDGKIIPKSNGREVLTELTTFRRKHRIPKSNTVFDSDGVGAFLGGWIEDGVAFKNGGRPIQVKNDPAEYFNLKTQCFYSSSDLVNSAEYYVHPDCPEDIKVRLLSELRYIKRDKVESDGKLRIEPKEKVKNALGRSPDVAETFMMHSVTRLKGVWV